MSGQIFYPNTFLIWQDASQLFNSQPFWFQWSCPSSKSSNSPLIQRISLVNSVESALNLIKQQQTLGCTVYLICESIKNELTDHLLSDNMIDIYGDKLFLVDLADLSDLIDLLSSPDIEVVECWEKLCIDRLTAPAKPALKGVSSETHQAFTSVYIQAIEHWYRRLPPIERVGLEPTRSFNAKEFIQSRDNTWYFHHRRFPPAHFTLHWNNDEKRYQATGGGVFLHQMPKLCLGDQTLTPGETDQDIINQDIINKFWRAWLEHFNANGVVIPLPRGLPKRSDEPSYAQQSRTGTYKSGAASSESDRESNALDNEWKTIEQGPLKIQCGPGVNRSFMISIETTEPDQKRVLIRFLSAEGEPVGEIGEVALEPMSESVLEGTWEGQPPEGSGSFKIFTTSR